MLTQSASQVRRLFETRFPGIKIALRSTVHKLYNKFQATESVEPKKHHKQRRLKNAVYNTNPCTLEELKRNMREEINNISREELQRVMGNFINMCQKNVWTTKVVSSSTSVNKVGEYGNL